MSDFVRPSTVRLTLSGDRWIDVKGRLNAGETRAMFARMIPKGGGLTVSATGATSREIELDPLAVGLAQVAAYLLDWNLTDDDGAQVAIKGQPADVVASAVDALDYDAYQEIVAAVQKHHDAMDAARAEEKKRRSSSPTFATT